MKHEPKHTLIEELRHAGEELDSLLNTFLHKVNKNSPTRMARAVKICGDMQHGGIPDLLPLSRARVGDRSWRACGNRRVPPLLLRFAQQEGACKRLLFSHHSWIQRVFSPDLHECKNSIRQVLFEFLGVGYR